MLGTGLLVVSGVWLSWQLRNRSRRGKSSKPEPFFRLARCFVLWSTSDVETMFEQFEKQAHDLGIELPPRGGLSGAEYLSSRTADIQSSIARRYGSTAEGVFRFSTTVSLLPTTFESRERFRRQKETAKEQASIFGTEFLVRTVKFLEELPCPLPEFVEKLESLTGALPNRV